MAHTIFVFYSQCVNIKGEDVQKCTEVFPAEDVYLFSVRISIRYHLLRAVGVLIGLCFIITDADSFRGRFDTKLLILMLCETGSFHSKWAPKENPHRPVKRIIFR